MIITIVAVSAALLLVTLMYCNRRVVTIHEDEQLIIETLTDVKVETGPKICVLPLFIRSCTKQKVLSLVKSEYCIVKNIVSGKRHVEVGPKLVYLKPYDHIEKDASSRSSKRKAISLKANEYVRFLDNATGKVRIVYGEQGGVVPKPDEVMMDGNKLQATDLRSFEYMKVKDKKTGIVRTEKGEKLVFLGEFDVIMERCKAISLKVNEYVRFLNNATGKVRVIHGEQGGVVPLPDEVLIDGKTMEAVNLRVFEYIKVRNKETGVVRTEKGPKLVFLGAFDCFLGETEEAIEIDEETAVLVRNKETGQQHLVTQKKLFVPADNEEIMDVQKLIKLADYQACIIRDKDGKERCVYGSNPDERCFFLQPYSELVSLWWSRGRRRERRDLEIRKIDLRPMYMSFEFNCRTNDNVELILEGSFFWELVDLEAMLKFTNDTTGDICNHARSRFIEKVSRVTLQEFMTEFNNIAKEVHTDDDSNFYIQRGVKVHSLEVTRYHCAEASTAHILEQIIQETTNKMNRIQKQESENEVQLQQIRGVIDEEKARGELLSIQAENSNKRSKMEGMVEAERVISFLDEIGKSFPNMDDGTKISLWNTLRKEDALKAVATSNAKLYFTPAEVNLSIENHDHVHEDPL